VHSPRGGRHLAAAPERVEATYRLEARGRHLLLYYLRLDDVELAGQCPGGRLHPGALRRLPFYPEPGELFRLAEEVGISIFGTSARYLASLEQAGEKPGRRFRLESLKTILSTGSPLSVESFQYVYRDIKEDVCLSSISGAPISSPALSWAALSSPFTPERSSAGAWDEGGGL